MEHQKKHANVLDLDFTIQNNIFFCNLFDKKEKFSIFFIRMSHWSSNILSSIFYDVIFAGFLWIAVCILGLPEFSPQEHELYLRMIIQAEEENRNKIIRQVKNEFQQNPNILNKYQSSSTKIMNWLRPIKVHPIYENS